jgi:hypothetical protein
MIPAGALMGRRMERRAWRELGGVFIGALLAAAQAGCGGGSATADAATGGDAQVGLDGRITVDGPPTIDASQAGSFVTGDVDGVTRRVEVDLRAGTAGLGPGEIWVTAGTSTADAWNVYMPNSVGTSSCPADWVARFEPDGVVLRSDAGGDCSVTVTQAAPAVGDVIEGTFTATLKTMGSASTPRTAVVTNGAFHLTRNFQ